jgi:hypothetical protein
MKKLLTLSFLLALIATTSFKGFSQAYKQGDNLLNATIGIGNVYGFGIGASFEHGFTENISAGGSFDYLNYNYLGVSGSSLLYFAVRGSYHAGELLKTGDKLDPYIGLGLGYVSWPGIYSGIGASGIFFQGHLGARYWFSDNLGGVAEVGAGAATLKLGVALKF